MGLSRNLNKNILLLVNFVLAVLGLVLIGFSILFLVSANEATVDKGERFAGGLMLAMGLAVLAVPIFGSLAVIHEAERRLLVYVFALAFLIMLQLLMCSMASMGEKDGVGGKVHEGFEKLWEFEQKEPGSLAFYEDWLHCCGVNNTADYHNIGHAVPPSCCVKHNCSSKDNIYTMGCEEKLIEYYSEKFLAFQIVAYILIVIEIVAAALGWILYSRVRNESRRGRVDWM